MIHSSFLIPNSSLYYADLGSGWQAVKRCLIIGPGRVFDNSPEFEARMRYEKV
jgi:hypothetical protein